MIVARTNGPQIQSIGALPEQEPRSHSRHGYINPARLLDRLWPEPDWEAEAETDPWGTALRHAFRDAAGGGYISWEKKEAKQGQLMSWVKRARATRRVADRLCGQDALTWIAEGFGLDASRRVIQSRKWVGCNPFEISANALLVACVGVPPTMPPRHHYISF